jgi:ethanolamine ammonia-lyase large subunit
MNKANELRSGDVQAGLCAGATASGWRPSGCSRSSPSTTSTKPRACPTSRTSSPGSAKTAATRARRRLNGRRLAEVREWILDTRTTGEDLLAVSPGLTPEMVAGVTKLMSNMDLVVAARKIRVVVRCNNTLGLPGRISSRLQPNHPRDSVEGILAVVLDGLSYGNGDAVIGVNPSTETVESTAEILTRTKALMTKPRGADAELRALAHHHPDAGDAEGSAARPVLPVDRGLRGGQPNFGVSVALLDEAMAMTRELGTAKGPNVMYFETGQGTALSADAHHGTDQLTMEARAYGLARRYSPSWSTASWASSGRSTSTTASRSPARASKTTSWASSAALDGLRRLLHQPRRVRSERRREPRDAPRGGGRELPHGHPRGRRRDAQLRDHVVSQQRGAARDPRAAPGARVRGVDGAAGLCGARGR